MSIKDKANISTGSSSKAANTPPPANSLAAKAGLVKKFNEEQGVEVDNETGTSHKKYKK